MKQNMIILFILIFYIRNKEGSEFCREINDINDSNINGTWKEKERAVWSNCSRGGKADCGYGLM